MVYDNSSVRRQDRLLPEERAMELLLNAEYGILSMVSGDGGGYGIPLNFAIDEDKIYFHCAPEGEKLRNVAADNRVSFCIVGDTRVIPNKFTTAYESVIVKGSVTTDLTDEEKMHALELIIDKYSARYKVSGMKYAAKSFGRTGILRLDVESVSGKSKFYK